MKGIISISFTFLVIWNSSNAQSIHNSTSEGWCSETTVEHPDLAYGNSWASWGANFTNHRYASDDQTTLTAENVGQLKLKWAFAVPGVRDMRSQPAIAGDWLFLAGRDNIIRALDSKNGCIRWEQKMIVNLRSGIAIGDLGHETPSLVVGDEAGYVHVLNSMTGEVIWSVRADEHAYAWITGTPLPYRGKVYVPVSSLEVAIAQDPLYECCTFRGKVVALDGFTGELIWEYLTVQQIPSEQGVNASGATMWGPSGVPVWSSVTVDEARNRLYVGTGQNLSQPWTHESSAIHAIEMNTGERAWIFQGTKGDAWNMACISEKALPGLPEDHSDNCPDDYGPDFDFGAAPILMTLPDGSDILVAGQKSGVVFGLDPDQNGSVVWETRVGRGGMLGGIHWGMAANETTVFVPNSDREEGIEYEHDPMPGMTAINALNGEILWATTALDDTCDDNPTCHPGFSSPATAIPGAVFAGALDGVLQAFSAENGSRLWSYNTVQEYETVNGVKGVGGSIDVAGPVVVGNMVYVLSGYGLWFQMPGNVLLAFSLEP